MSRKLPLGRKEDFHLEFKGNEALREPEKIAREVVAFLNAEGGEVWVGLREENGRAVAVEPIADPDQEQRRLLDYLIETVEPVPAGEIQVEVVEAEGEGPVLRVEARPDEARRPYACLRKGGRHFVIRIADRIRPLSREEILGQAPRSDEAFLDRALELIREERNDRQEQRVEVLWLRLEPATPPREVDLDLQDRRLEELLTDSSRSGNRRDGWSFSRFLQRPRLRVGRLTTSGEEEPFRVELRREGGLLFVSPLSGLHWQGQSKEIWPLALCELPVSALRIAGAVYQDRIPPDRQIVVDLALIGIQGWTLRPGTPGRGFEFMASNPARIEGDDDFLLDRPLIVRTGDLVENPDAIGYRLIERVYEAFGFRREQMPQVFDPVTRRLVLPS
jgi:Putative DNA-binding domain